ncbi:glycoside hydrolase family 127 protein [Salinactinospora qingdaonensis]|uniref:Glycoside hydrolase family 127 protein n=1 Tax=Salinactinospora qingdaonensis TaxID=702744 RepID=A0ABP7G189_9ACTN
MTESIAQAEATSSPLPDPTGGRPVTPTRRTLRPLGLGEVRVTGGFWGRRQRVNGDATLQHCRHWMDHLGWTTNFTDPAGPGSAQRRGREFSDSEVYKMLEAMAWETGRSTEFAQRWNSHIDELTAAIANAQAPDGYVNTAFGGHGRRPRYTDLNFGHELYCTGHLIQAAVARARTYGPDPLLDVARRAADHVCATFGPHGIQSVGGHPEIEPALVELARLTGEQRYLDQAALFVERRGHRRLPEHEAGWPYFQDDIPVRHANVLRGHAVRALYLSCGAVDTAVETGDTELLEAVAAQYERTLARRTYITGGMGSHHAGESFGDDFVLPADRAYSETCAGVASMMLAWRLLLATGEPRYADAIERVLYNVIATSVADDGTSFFYANTLHQRVPTEPVAPDKESLRFGGGSRAPWFEVSCCLPNVARTLASLGGYLVTADAEGVQLHQYTDAEVRTRLDDGRPVGLQVRTDYPETGTIVIRVTETGDGPWSLTLRVPEWVSGAVLSGAVGRRSVEPGTVVVRRAFTVGEELRLELPMSPRWTFPDPRIDAVRGCVAVERGPLVLCAESTDQDGAPDAVDLDSLRIDTGVRPRDAASGATVSGRFQPPAGDGLPYYPSQPPRGEAHPQSIRLVPYYRWARRGPSTMRVWLPKDD